MDSLRQKQAQYGVLQALLGAMPAVPPRELPKVDLPAEVVGFPLEIDGLAVGLFLVADRRKYHTFFYIKARKAGSSGRTGAKTWPVCSLGSLGIPAPCPSESRIVSAVTSRLTRDSPFRPSSRMICRKSMRLGWHTTSRMEGRSTKLEDKKERELKFPLFSLTILYCRLVILAGCSHRHLSPRYQEGPLADRHPPRRARRQRRCRRSRDRCHGCRPRLHR